jgi:hypothetical protein
MDTSKMQTSKFSCIDPEEIYSELERFVHWLAYNNQNPNNVMMEEDELVGELLLEFAKGMEYYKEKNLSKTQLKAVLRKMMDNRIAELRHMHYGTHRKAIASSMSMDDDSNGLEEFVSDSSTDPSVICDSKLRIIQTRNRLSDTAKQVFDAMLFGNERLTRFVKLSVTRRNNKYKNARASVKTWHIAEALMLQDRQVRTAMKEIKSVYAEVIANG